MVEKSRWFLHQPHIDAVFRPIFRLIPRSTEKILDSLLNQLIIYYMHLLLSSLNIPMVNKISFIIIDVALVSTSNICMGHSYRLSRQITILRGRGFSALSSDETDDWMERPCGRDRKNRGSVSQHRPSLAIIT